MERLSGSSHLAPTLAGVATPTKLIAIHRKHKFSAGHPTGHKKPATWGKKQTDSGEQKHGRERHPAPVTNDVPFRCFSSPQDVNLCALLPTPRYEKQLKTGNMCLPTSTSPLLGYFTKHPSFSCFQTSNNKALISCA